MNFNFWKKSWSNYIATFLLIIILALSAFKMHQHISIGHDWGGDFALYVDQAQAIVKGDLNGLYEKNKITVDYSSRLQGPYLYPMGYPLLLSPMVALLGLNFYWLKIFTDLFFFIGMGVLFYLFKTEFKSFFPSLLIISILGFSEHFLFHGDQILSDFPFFFFCFLSFFLFKERMSFKEQVMLGCIIFYAFLIRDLGLLLLPSLFCYQITRIPFNEFLRTQSLSYLTFFFLSLLSFFVFPFGSKNHYELFVNQISWSSIEENFDYYLELFELFFREIDNYDWVAFLLISLFLIGLITSFKKNIHFAVFLLSSLMILLLWPYQQGVRFLFPLLPLVLMFILKPIEYLPKWPRYLIAYPFFIFLSHSYFNKTLNMNAENLKLETNQIYQEENIALYKYVKENYSTNDTIVFFKPRVLRMFTGVNSIFLEASKFKSSPHSHLITFKPWTDNENLEGLVVEKDLPRFTVYSKNEDK